MRTSLTVPALLLTCSLVGCGFQRTTISVVNGNPLVASRYGDELADSMANLVISNDPILKDPKIRSVVDEEIALGKQMGTDARSVEGEGMKGGVIPVKAEMDGIILYVHDLLYFSSDFTTKPGPDLHVYLTAAVDPRDMPFPDATAIDLGTIQSAYGAQTYAVPHQKNPMLYRTFVLFDKKLQRLYGFAQLSK